jgi:hypothetical protein
MENRTILNLDIKSSSALDRGGAGRDLAHFPRGSLGIGAVKDGRPCDDPVTPGADHIREVVPVHAPINFDRQR